MMLCLPDILREYQRNIVCRLRQRMAEGHKRVLMQGACGSGKTTVSSEIVRQAVAKNKRVLFLAHRRRLIKQKSDRLAEFGIEHGIVMAGKPRTPSLVQIASKDTLIAREDREGLPPADLVIIDEAHYGGKGYAELLAHYGNAYQLGMTATPAQSSDGRGLGDWYTAIECTVPTSQLIRDGFLVRVRPYAPEAIIRRKGEKRGLGGDPVASWKRLACGRPTVLFASRVSASLEVKDAFNRAGIPAEHMDAKTSDEAREGVIARVKAGFTKVVCQVGLFVEGIDIPELSCCILWRMAGSYVLFIQALGRVMRAHPSKTDAILIDHSGAVLVHGFPDEDVEWTLDTDDSVDRRIRQARKDGKMRKPIQCPVCFNLFSGGLTCDACGHTIVPKRQKQKVFNKDELLVEVERCRDANEKREVYGRVWVKCLWVTAAKNGPLRQAVAMFRSQMGKFPDQCSGLPDMPMKSQWHRPVTEVFPQYARRKVAV
jgi:DNA repair protein RadD